MAERLNTAVELARLAAVVEAKMKADDAYYQEQRKQSEEAKAQRESMSQDILAIRKDHTAMDNRVIKIEADVREMKPVIGSIVSTKAKLAGGIIVLGAIGTVAIGFLTYFKQQIAAILWGA